MRPKHLFTPDNIEKNNEHYEYAEDLFKRKGFCIIKNLFSKEDILYLRDLCLSKNNYSLIHPELGNIYTYFYRNRKKDNNKRVIQIGIKIHEIRNSILLQSNSDQHLRSYCWRFAINPLNKESVIDHQLNHCYSPILQIRLCLWKHQYLIS